MQRRSFVSCAAAACAALAFSHAEPVVAAGSEIATTGAARDYRLSGPFAHENLAIYLVHGAPGGGPVPLTLQEALETGGFKVYETNDVNELAVQNLGVDPVFIQSGDIVKGGQQDRVLTVSLVLPPKSGRVTIGAFCVEQGRWAARGQERSDSFSSAAEALPSRQAKLAIKAPRPAAGSGHGADIGSRQHEVWRGVADMQGKLEKSLGTSVAAEVSPSSLQLALEHEKLQESRAAYFDALYRVATREPDVVGYVFAINGRVNSADVYPSNGLFLKMWPKLLKASAAEAISEIDGQRAGPPPVRLVEDFLQSAERGRARRDTLARHAELETREAAESYFFESRTSGGDWVHRNYLAKQ